MKNFVFTIALIFIARLCIGQNFQKVEVQTDNGPEIFYEIIDSTYTKGRHQIMITRIDSADFFAMIGSNIQKQYDQLAKAKIMKAKAENQISELQDVLNQINAQANYQAWTTKALGPILKGQYEYTRDSKLHHVELSSTGQGTINDVPAIRIIPLSRNYLVLIDLERGNDIINLYKEGKTPIFRGISSRVGEIKFQRKLNQEK